MLAHLLHLTIAAAAYYAGELPVLPPGALAPERQLELLRPAFVARSQPEDVGFRRVPERVAPVLTAREAIAVDLPSGAVLYAKRPGARVAIASTTKLMTALLVLEKGNFDTVLTVPARAFGLEGTRQWLAIGGRYTVRDLLSALLISSSAEAAITLAEHVDGSVDAFVRHMNAKALELGLTGTSFANPVGIDDPRNYSTAHDLATLFHVFWGTELFVREDMQRTSKRIVSEQGGAVTLTATNQLLDVPGYSVIAGKTGTTDEARQALVAVSRLFDREILTIVLESDDRVKDTKTLLTWLEKAWTRLPATGN